MITIDLPVCYRCGVPHVPDDIKARVANGENITVRITYGQGVAANVLRWGTGALNIDGTRVATDESLNGGAYAVSCTARDDGWRMHRAGAGNYEQPAGRWPANLCHDGSDEVMQAFARFGEKNGGHHPASRGRGNISTSGHRGQDGLVERNADTGTAARFFFSAKASSDERGAGNDHPTVKPLELMQWLCRLVTPPGGTVLDPFLGSGTTMVAADRERFNGIGIELDAKYLDVARRRFEKDAGLFAEMTG